MAISVKEGQQSLVLSVAAVCPLDVDILMFALSKVRLFAVLHCCFSPSTSGFDKLFGSPQHIPVVALVILLTSVTSGGLFD